MVTYQNNHPTIQREKRKANSNTEHWLSCKHSTMKQQTPGKIELKSLGWSKDLSFLQLGSFMPFPFIQKSLQCKERKWKRNEHQGWHITMFLESSGQQSCLAFPLLQFDSSGPMEQEQPHDIHKLVEG